jgi:acyl-CoA synthetase (AMP-forming)/AMP-acid ligase II
MVSYPFSRLQARERTMKKMPATAIVARNSLAYIARVFAFGETRRTLVRVQDANQTADLHGIAIDECIEVAQENGWYSTRHELIRDDQPAQVVFTSGTEGTPKGIVLSYANLADTADRVVSAMGMTSEIREYVGVPVTYSFGMGRVRAICAVGGRAYLPREFDPMELARMLAAGEVNALSAVPTLLRLLLELPEVIGDAGRKLRWMEIGSQYMSAGEKRRIRELFPNARIVQHYGLTEASRSTFLDVSRAADNALESVGRPEGAVEIGFDAQGRIRIKGPHVARWRVDAEGLHALCDADGWLQTNDLGHLRDGYLFFDGRADDLINSGGVKVAPDVLEDKIRARLGVGSRIAVARVKDESRGEAILAVIEGSQESLPRLREAATASLSEMGIEAAGSLHVRHVEAIPVTATGKPRRRELSAGFDTEQKSVAPVLQPRKDAERDVRGVFEHVFPGAAVKSDDTFESLGGDSLRYIQFSMRFERLFGVLPPQWESLSVSQLQQRVESAARPSWPSLETGTLFRALAMMLIVARHTSAFIYSKQYAAGVLLFALGGYALIRFQLPEIIRKGSSRSTLVTALLVAIPTILVVGPSQLMTHTFEPLQYVMLSNFVDPADPRRINVASFYFAEIYFQLLLFAALVFSVPRVRALFRDRPIPSALALFAAAVGVKVFLDAVWDTNYLFQRVPQNYAWSFCLGILVAVSRTTPERLLTFALIAICSYVIWGFSLVAPLLFGGGLALVLFIRSVPVPALVKSLIGEIAAASMFIYLTHFQVHDIVTKVLGQEMPWVSVVAVTMAGILFAYSYNYAQRLVSRTRIGARFFGWLAG